MENIGDYIIILFFIVSAIASLIKKKKKPEENQEDTSAGDSTGKPGTNDPFEETSVIFEKGGEDELSEVDRYFEEAIKKSRKSETQSHGYNEPDISASEEAIFKNSEVSQKLNEYASKFSEKSHAERMQDIRSTAYKDYLLEKKSQDKKRLNNSAQRIIDRLNSPRDLKDIILFNEVINKPVALRRKK